MPGEKVWVYNPSLKKGVSPKLTRQWVGPCEVLEQLSDVVYRVSVDGWWCYTETVGTLPAPGGWMSRHTQLTQHGSTHTDKSSDSNRQWGVGHATPQAHRRRWRPPRCYQDCVVG